MRLLSAPLGTIRFQTFTLEDEIFLEIDTKSQNNSQTTILIEIYTNNFESKFRICKYGARPTRKLLSLNLSVIQSKEKNERILDSFFTPILIEIPNPLV